jgi:hypothetical protein
LDKRRKKQLLGMDRRAEGTLYLHAHGDVIYGFLSISVKQEKEIVIDEVCFSFFFHAKMCSDFLVSPQLKSHISPVL